MTPTNPKGPFDHGTSASLAKTFLPFPPGAILPHPQAAPPHSTNEAVRVVVVEAVPRVRLKQIWVRSCHSWLIDRGAFAQKKHNWGQSRKW